MKLMMTVRIPVEAGNRAIADGSMQAAFEALMEKIKPEAAYFTMIDGCRGAIFVHEVEEVYKLLTIHEPLLAALGAMIEEVPVLSWADMQRAMEETR